MIDWDFGDSILLNFNKDNDRNPAYPKINAESSSSLYSTPFSQKKDQKISTDLNGTQNEVNLIPFNNTNSLSNFKLPFTVLEKYKKNGIECLFPWQQECLLTGNALEGGMLFGIYEITCIACTFHNFLDRWLYMIAIYPKNCESLTL